MPAFIFSRMARQLHWTELKGGIIAAAAISILVLATLLFARVGALHGKKVTLYIVTDDATGVLPGTDVWLGGKKEGLVKDVTFRAPSTDTLERLLVRMDFLRDGLSNVRRDSYAQIRPGGSLIGAPIVFISPGTATSPPLHDGDTLHTIEKPSIAALVGDVSTIGPEFASLRKEVKDLTVKVSRPVGTLGSFRASGMAQMTDVGGRMSRLTARATNGNGTLALATRTKLFNRASAAMSRADSIRALLISSNTSVGRFRSDTTLAAKAGKVMAELDSLRAILADPMGSIAGGRSDSTLSRELGRSRALLDSVVTDAKKNPRRYINF
jgi:phospholipid/cholesterol/gamma-HCH transport system substrate-binding protein